MSDKKDINTTVNQNPTGGSTKKDPYFDAKAEQYKGRYQPSKLHEMNLIAYVESNDGTLKPVYREEQ
jgi:hypothetical protein